MPNDWNKITVQVRMMVNVLGLIHVILGVVILVGGSSRFPAPTYTPLVNFVSGNIWLYGMAFVLAGGLMLAHKLGGVITGLAMGWLLMDMWAALFLYAVIEFPNAGATAFVAYGGYALMDVIFMVKIHLYRRRFRNRR